MIFRNGYWTTGGKKRPHRIYVLPENGNEADKMWDVVILQGVIEGNNVYAKYEHKGKLVDCEVYAFRFKPISRLEMEEIIEDNLHVSARVTHLGIPKNARIIYAPPYDKDQWQFGPTTR